MKRASLVLTLSITALPILVNAQQKSLTSVNKPSKKSDLKDSVSDSTRKFQRLLEAAVKVESTPIKASIAALLGLPDSSLYKEIEADPNQKTSVRFCAVIYEAGKEAKKPVCAIIAKRFISGKDSKTQYYRVDLNGKLERAVETQTKRDEDGKTVKGSGVKFDQDIQSPETRNNFNSEMSYWLQDWLKKSQKSANNKPAPGPKTASL